jgi:hypothetical protein
MVQSSVRGRGPLRSAKICECHPVVLFIIGDEYQIFVAEDSTAVQQLHVPIGHHVEAARAQYYMRQLRW